MSPHRFSHSASHHGTGHLYPDGEESFEHWFKEAADLDNRFGRTPGAIRGLEDIPPRGGPRWGSQDGRYVYEEGFWDGNTVFDANLGMSVWIRVRNTNVLPTTIRITSLAPHNESQAFYLLPSMEHTFHFAHLMENPVPWRFRIETYADVFSVFYEIESNWIPGMPL